MTLIDERKAALAINILSVLIGLFFVFMGIFAYQVLIGFICIFLGVSIILINAVILTKAIILAKTDKRCYADAVMAAICMMIGLVFTMIYDHWIVSVSFGAALLAMSLVRIIISKNWKIQMKREIPIFIISALLFLNIMDQVFRWAIVACGGILVILGIVNIILSSIPMKNGTSGTTFSGKKISDKDSTVIDADIREL